MARMARVGEFLKDVLVPAGKTSTDRWINGAMMYGPDLGFAVMAGAMAPGDQFNPAVMAEDGLISLGGTVGSGVLSRLAGRKFFPGNEEARGRLQMFTDLAGTTFLQMGAPRPALDAAIRDEFKSRQAQQQAEQEHEQMTAYEQLANALLTTGGMVNPGAYL